MLYDSNARKFGKDYDIKVVLVGLLSLIGAATGFVFQKNMNKLKDEISLFVLIFGVAFCSLILQAIFASYYEKADFSINETGLFGFLRQDNFINAFIGLGFAAGFVPYCGYIFILNHFSL